MNKNPFISLIVVGFYRDNKFLRCIRSLTSLTYDNYEIILVWSQKTDDFDTLKFITQNNISTEKIKIFEYVENVGYAKGNNLGVEKAKGEYVLIINPDVEVEAGFLERLMSTFNLLVKKKGTDKIILGPRICNPNGRIEYSRRTINFLGFSNMNITKTKKIRRTQAISGCAFIIKKDYYNDLNGFDERYFMYHEDIDFSIRAYSNSFLMYIDNSICLWHLKNDSGYKLSKFKYYYHERNRIMMTLEHTNKKFRMTLCHLLFEPLHIVFAISRGFLRTRLKVYKYFFKNYFRILRDHSKENNIFDIYYEISGIFNEVDTNSLIFKFLSLYSRILYYFYKK
ncbi:MAG: glycosyltransferase family 2 protein [Promethearchaeota archaeon]